MTPVAFPLLASRGWGEPLAGILRWAFGAGRAIYGGLVTPKDTNKKVCGPSEQSFGKVARVRPGMFLLRMYEGGEHWMSQDCIYLIEDAKVTLICEREGLVRYISEPPAEAGIRTI